MASIHPVKLLIDRNGFQAAAHLGDLLGARKGERLSSFLVAIHSLPNWSCEFTAGGGISDSDLESCDIFFEPTRRPRCPFSEAEVKAILDFYRLGGRLALFSNHPSLTVEDARIAEPLGVTIVPETIQDTRGKRIEFRPPEFHSHRILRGVSSIVINNCCKLQVLEATPIVSLPSELQSDDSVPAHFAVACENDNDGRAVVVADSGFLGSPGTSIPGAGLFDEGDNAIFALNIFKWLAGEAGPLLSEALWRGEGTQGKPPARGAPIAPEPLRHSVRRGQLEQSERGVGAYTWCAGPEGREAPELVVPGPRWGRLEVEPPPERSRA